MKFRKALYDDWEFIRNLRNQLKDHFISKHEITKEEHQQFMINNLNCYYVAEIPWEEGGTDIRHGFIGVVVTKDGYQDIRFAIDPRLQGRGLGTEMLKFIGKEFPYAIGKVSKDNIASNKAFEKAGFELFKENDKFKYWVSHFDDYRIWEGIDEN